MAWKPLTSCCTAILTLSALAAPTRAHPLGETSVNQYLVLRVERDGLHVGYRVDFAETPTATELRTLDADGDGTVSDTERANYLAARQADLASRISLTLNGHDCDLKVTDASLKLTDAPDGRETLLIMLDLLAPRPTWPANAPHADLTIGNYSRIPGWREAAALAGDGCWITTDAKRAKAKVLDTRAETADEGKDWKLTFDFESKPPATTTTTTTTAPTPTPKDPTHTPNQ